MTNSKIVGVCSPLDVVESVKEYEKCYKEVLQKIGGASALENAEPPLKYELIYAQEFFKAFDSFSSMSISFENLQTALKNGIDKITRDRLEGKVPPSPSTSNRVDSNVQGVPSFGRSNTPNQPPPIQRSDMPSVHSNNPFANALGGGNNERDNSMLDHSGLGNVKYDQYGGNNPPIAPAYNPQGAGMSSMTVQPNPDQQARISSLETQLNQQRQLIDDLRRLDDDQKSMIERLKSEKRGLEGDIDRERRKAKDGSGSGGPDQRAEIQKLQQTIQLLESEVQNLNKENNKMFEALRSQTPKGQSGSDEVQQLKSKIAQLTTENGYLKDQLGGGANPRGLSGNSGALEQELLFLKQKNNRLESEVAALKDQSIISSNQEITALQAEMRKLKSEASLEIKALKSKLIVAEEKANALLDQYKDKLASGYSSETQKPAGVFDTKKFLQELYSTTSSAYDRDPFSTSDYSNRAGALGPTPYLSSGLVTSLKEQEQAVPRGYIGGHSRSRSPISKPLRYESNPAAYQYTAATGSPIGQVAHYRLGKSPVAVPAGTNDVGYRSRPASITRASFEGVPSPIELRASHVSTVSIPLNGNGGEYSYPASQGLGGSERRSISRGRPSTGLQGFSDQYMQRTAGLYSSPQLDTRPVRRVSQGQDYSREPPRDTLISIYGGQQPRPLTTRPPTDPGPSQTFLSEFSRKIRDLQ